jgi:hypothetical protein
MRDPESFCPSARALDGDGEPDPWSYEMTELGIITALPLSGARLALSQLRRLPDFIPRPDLAAICDQRLVFARRMSCRFAEDEMERRPGISMSS